MSGRRFPDRELWACAEDVFRQHGQAAQLFVAGRIGERAVAGDDDGVEMWRAIGSRVLQLQMSSRP